MAKGIVRRLYDMAPRSPQGIRANEAGLQAPRKTPGFSRARITSHPAMKYTQLLDGQALAGKFTISDGTEDATVTPEGYLDVKAHTPEKCFAANYASAQVDTTIITPTSGKKIRIVSVYTSVGANATNVTLAFVTSGNIFFKLYTEKKSSQTGNIICAVGGTNEAIKLSCPATTFVSIGYDEVS